MNIFENQIISQINAKHRDGYKFLYENFYASLCNFSAHFLVKKEEAEDIVQDVFMKLWQSDATFDSITALTSFLYLSVKNTSLNAIRNRAKWSELDPLDKIDADNLKEGQTIEQLLIQEEFYREIYNAINKLSPKRREIIMLSMEGYSIIEIANRTGVSVNTVKTLKLKAYRLLRDTIEPSMLTFQYSS